MVKIALTELADYEKEFLKLCKKKGWKCVADEDGCPILIPNAQKKRELYKVAPQGGNKCAVVITVPHSKTKNKIKKKFKKSKVDFEILIEGDTEAILVFDIKRLAKVVQILSLKKKANRKPPPKEVWEKAIKKAHDKLRETRWNKPG
jgi:hypothetical protein